jgi:hypothetical protein
MTLTHREGFKILLGKTGSGKPNVAPQHTNSENGISSTNLEAMMTNRTPAA